MVATGLHLMPNLLLPVMLITKPLPDVSAKQQLGGSLIPSCPSVDRHPGRYPDQSLGTAGEAH
jgi:hypothetical protein